MSKLNDLKKYFPSEKIDALIISSVSDIFYLSGIGNFSNEEREAFIFITPDSQYILTDARYAEMVEKMAPGFELLLISSEKSWKKHLNDLSDKYKIKRVGVDENEISASEHKTLKEFFPEIIHFQTNQPRIIKSDEEIDFIQKACAIGDKAFDYLISKIKPGISEKELAFELEFFIKKNGGEISFKPIVAFGTNSSVPHHHTGNTKLETKTGQFVLLDFGVKIEGYCSDMTRTFFWGKSSSKQSDIYNVVLNAQKKAIKFVEKNIGKKILTSDIDKAAREYIISKRYPSIPHSLGHGIGIQVHERPFLSPKSKEVLKSGMVFSIEPGIYMPGFGGVRIEDLFLFRAKKLTKLTRSKNQLIEL